MGVMMEPLWMLYLDQDDMPSKGRAVGTKTVQLDRQVCLFISP
jgi:signal recognition particle subunit SEC65